MSGPMVGNVHFLSTIHDKHKERGLYLSHSVNKETERIEINYHVECNVCVCFRRLGPSHISDSKGL